MRQALNNLQSTFEGFGYVNSENVFKVCILVPNSCKINYKSCYSVLYGVVPTSVYNSIIIFMLFLWQVCDEPHPLLIKDMLTHCSKSDLDNAYKIMLQLWKMGYSAEDIITNVFRVCKTHELAEYIKLEFIKEIGYTHMKIVQGTNSLLQMAALLAKLCQITSSE